MLTLAFESFQELLSPVSNYKALREAITNVPSTEASVPYLGIYLGDLTFIEEGNPDTMNDLINFAKFRMIVNTITLMQHRQVHTRTPVSTTFESHTQQ